MSDLRLIKSNEPGPPPLDSCYGCGCYALTLFVVLVLFSMLAFTLF